MNPLNFITLRPTTSNQSTASGYVTTKEEDIDTFRAAGSWMIARRKHQLKLEADKLPQVYCIPGTGKARIR